MILIDLDELKFKAHATLLGASLIGVAVLLTIILWTDFPVLPRIVSVIFEVALIGAGVGFFLWMCYHMGRVLLVMACLLEELEEENEDDERGGTVSN